MVDLTNEGRAYVYESFSTGPSQYAARSWQGDQAGALFGWSVGTAGDVNGDGYADVIVGAYAWNDYYLDKGKRLGIPRRLDRSARHGCLAR